MKQINQGTDSALQSGIYRHCFIDSINILRNSILNSFRTKKPAPLFATFSNFLPLSTQRAAYPIECITLKVMDIWAVDKLGIRKKHFE